MLPASLKVGRQAQKRPKMLPASLYLGRQEHHTRKTHKKEQPQLLFLCLGRDSNPHGRFGPRDFLTTMAFATRDAARRSVCGLDYSFTIDL